MYVCNEGKFNHKHLDELIQCLIRGEQTQNLNAEKTQCRKHEINLGEKRYRSTSAKYSLQSPREQPIIKTNNRCVSGTEQIRSKNRHFQSRALICQTWKETKSCFFFFLNEHVNATDILLTLYSMYRPFPFVIQALTHN